MGQFWVEWLPPSVAPGIEKAEQHRVKVLFEAIREDWLRKEDLNPADRSQATLRWLSLYHSSGVIHKRSYTEEEANLVLSTLLEIILKSKYDKAAQVRWSTVLYRMMARMKSKVSIKVEWRPLYQCVRAAYMEPLNTYTGPSVQENHKEVLLKLIRTLRRFFVPEAAQEIWALFKPKLLTLHPDFQEAAGWLAVLLPTSQVAQGGADWNGWLRDWMAVWAAQPNDNFLGMCMMGLISRLARFDTQCAVDWMPHLPQLLTHIQWSFQVPVGGATAQSPIGRGAQGMSRALFISEAGESHKDIAAPLLLVSLLERCRDVGGQDLGGQDLVLQALQRMASLLESYFHPSNTGQWTESLALFLKSLHSRFVRRLYIEHLPRNASTDVDMEDFEDDEEPDLGHIDIPDLDKPDVELDDEDMEGTEAVRGESDSKRPKLSKATQTKLAQILLQLATTAQYSKNRTLVGVACHVIADMAYVIPDVVLPLAYERFQAALEAVTATHQLESAVDVFSWCVRPLLRQGYLQPLSQDIGAERVSSGEVLAQSMMALLPGIDANDEHKAQSVFHFYVVAFSSLPVIEEGQPGFPLPAEAWLDELLASIFRMLINLESTDANGKDHVTFLMNDSSLYRPMAELLFARLSPALRLFAIRKLGRFAAETSLASMHEEVKTLASAAAKGDAAAAVEHVLLPLTRQLESELPSIQGAKSGHLSKVLEQNVKWKAAVIQTTLHSAGAAILPHKKVIMKIIAALFAAPSKELHQVAQGLLSNLLRNLCTYQVEDSFAAPVRAVVPREPGSLAMEPWLPERYGSLEAAVQPPAWREPSAEQLAWANELLEVHLRGACEQLRSLSSASGGDGNGQDLKLQLDALVKQVTACFVGAQSCIPEPASPATSRPTCGTPLTTHAQIGATVGKGEYRVQAAEALVAAVRSSAAASPEVVEMILQLLKYLLANGSMEYKSAREEKGILAGDERELEEPLLANLLHGQEGEKWQRRRPRWLAVTRVSADLLQRVAHCTYRPWASTEKPIVDLADLPDAYKAVYAELLRQSFNTYTAVRGTAVSAVMSACKRYPCLAPLGLIIAIRAIAKLPQLTETDLSAWLGCKRAGAAVYDKLQAEVYTRSGLPSLPAPTAQSAADEAEQVGIIEGACALLLGQPMYRLYSRQPEALAAVAAALMGSSGHQSPKAVQALSQAFITFAMGFIRPPMLDYCQMELGMYPEPVQAMLQKLLAAASPSAPVPMHWRYSLMSLAMFLFIMPPVDLPSAKALTEHCLSSALSQLQSVRTMAMTNCLFLLKYSQEPPAGKEKVAQAISAAVAGFISAHKDFGQAVLKQMTHSHPSNPGQNDQASKLRSFLASFQQMGTDEKAAQIIARVVEGKLLLWPQTFASVPQPMADQSYNLTHAGLVKGLADSAPEEAIPALRGPLTEALKGVQQDQDRPRTFAAAEALSGLLASSSSYAGGEASAWSDWLQPLLQQAVQAAPLEFSSLWACCVRFAVHSLSESGSGALGSLLDSISAPVDPGASSAAVVKHLEVQGYALAELALRRSSQSSSGLRSNQQTVTADVPGQVGGVTGIPGQAVEAPAHSDLRGGVTGTPGKQAAPVAEGRGASEDAVARFQRSCLEQLPGHFSQAGEGVRQMTAANASVLTASLLWRDPTGQAMDGSSGSGHLRSEALSLLEGIAAGLQEGTTKLLEAAKSTPENGGEAALDGAALLHDAALLRAWQAVRFVACAAKGQWGVNGAFLAPHLLHFAPSLLKLQEVPQPELQPLSMEAKTATAVLKYLQLQAPLLPPVTKMLQEAAQVDLWATRGASLAYTQVFWFRHMFLLSAEGAAAVEQLVVQLLSDKKLEVQELAARTLSGLIQGLPEADASSLRSRFLSKAEAMFPTRAARPQKSAEAGASAAEKHAVVLGLKAFVLAHPYDVPKWLPDLLLLLVRASLQPAPIKTSVRKTIGEFRRTHEEAALAEARKALTADQWDALQSVASPATYFA